MEEGLRHAPAYAPDRGAGREQAPKLERRAAVVAGDIELGQQIGGRYSHICARLMQLLFRGPNIGTLLDQTGGQAHRQVPRRRQGGDCKRLAVGLIGKPRRQGRQQAALLLKLLLERRQGRLSRRKVRLLSEHVRPRHTTEVELPAQYFKLLTLALDDVLRCLDLAAKRRLLDRCGDDIGGQRQKGGFNLEPLIIGLCLARLQGTPLSSPDVECIGNIHRRVEQAEEERRPAPPELGGRYLLAGA